MLKQVRFFAVVAFGLAAANFAAGTESSTSLLYQKNGAATHDWLGYSVASAGDVNGDGKADFIVGAPNAAPGGPSAAGSAYLYSGATGSLLFQKNGTAPGDELGYSVAGVGDLNGDGKADFIVGSPGGNPGGPMEDDTSSAYLYSGADGSLLFQKDGGVIDYLGCSVAGAGDVNGDGKADFIVGARFASPGGLFDAGSAYLYSGADGSLLYQKNGAAASDELGYSVAGAGDVNGDGKADFIVGAPFADPGGLVYAGSVYLYSGADGSLLLQKDGAAHDLLGHSVASAGELNGDGKADFIVGAAAASPDWLTFAGSAFVYSGATGALLLQINGAAERDNFGSSVAGAGDLNGDGKADFIVGAPAAGPGGLDYAGSAYVYSGATGALLLQINGAAVDDVLGISVADAGDVDGDGKAEFIVGAFAADPGGLFAAGSAFVYSLPCAAKGDMTADGSLTAADVVLMLNCAFLGTGTCALCFADVNCDGILTAADVVGELNRVFLGLIEPPWCGT